VFKKEIYGRINGLVEYPAMRDALKLKYVYEDVFLSEKIKLVGKVRFIWDLKVAGTARYGKGRTADQFRNFWRIKAYVHSCH